MAHKSNRYVNTYILTTAKKYKRLVNTFYSLMIRQSLMYPNQMELQRMPLNELRKEPLVPLQGIFYLISGGAPPKDKKTVPRQKIKNGLHYISDIFF